MNGACPRRTRTTTAPARRAPARTGPRRRPGSRRGRAWWRRRRRTAAGRGWSAARRSVPPRACRHPAPSMPCMGTTSMCEGSASSRLASITSRAVRRGGPGRWLTAPAIPVSGRAVSKAWRRITVAPAPVTVLLRSSRSTEIWLSSARDADLLCRGHGRAAGSSWAGDAPRNGHGHVWGHGAHERYGRAASPDSSTSGQR